MTVRCSFDGYWGGQVRLPPGSILRTYIFPRVLYSSERRLKLVGIQRCVNLRSVICFCYYVFVSPHETNRALKFVSLKKKHAWNHSADLLYLHRNFAINKM